MSKQTSPKIPIFPCFFLLHIHYPTARQIIEINKSTLPRFGSVKFSSSPIYIITFYTGDEQVVFSWLKTVCAKFAYNFGSKVLLSYMSIEMS